VERFNQRQGFLISATVHLVLMTLLTSREIRAPRKETATQDAKPRVARVMLPPREVLRQLLPPKLQPQPQPPTAPPAPVPPRPETKDRISVGAPSEERAKRLLLRPEDDLTAVAKGRPQAAPAPAPPPETVTAQAKPPGTPGMPQEKRAEGLMLPPGLGPLPRGQEAPPRGTDGAREPSITSSLRNLEKRIHDTGDQGVPSGTVQRTGPLSFDPQGADFTVWVNHFKNEVYRNWIVPSPR
jgi:hypothetical protein